MRSQRDVYAQASKANAGTAQKLYETADAGLGYAEELEKQSLAGTSGLKRAALSAVPMAAERRRL